MVTFHEPEEEYSFDRVNKKDIYTKIRVAVMFFVFVALVALIAKNDFDFDLLHSRTTILDNSCSPATSLVLRDDAEIRLVKAKNLLSLKMDQFQNVDGFARAYVTEEKDSRGKTIPVINVVYKSYSENNLHLGQDVCGFPLKVLYQ